MDTEVLRWFQQVADGATVTEVADLWMVSQPKVSRDLMALQREVGAPLLVKSGRVLRLTHAGAVFKRHADAIVNRLDDALAAVDQLVDPERGTVTLAYERTLGTWLVPSLVGEFLAVHPQVSFTLVVGGEDLAVLDEGRVDLAVLASRPNAPLFGGAREGVGRARRACVGSRCFASRCSSRSAPATGSRTSRRCRWPSWPTSRGWSCRRAR